jgi:hypothetical protein
MRDDLLSKEDSMKKKQYQFKGAVLEFDKIIDDRWVATTWAISPKQAKSNLLYRYKQETNRAIGSKLSLEGKITEVV